ncbi:glycosyl hydrolase family 2 [Bacteroidaceae bacterium HV4-6-C5C]|nr:glycosyl hydrolase family 2 [Bacteroidaceae bacterium HV4-6-C5C]
MKRILGSILLCLWVGAIYAQSISWPEITINSKPSARWWWMGNAVDKENLSRNLDAYAKAGMGTMEITPIYGVNGNDANEIPFLSDGWMKMLRHTENEAGHLGMQIDMNTGTGWPFGGPEVGIEDAACKLFVTEYKVSGGQMLDSKIEPQDEKQRPYAKLNRLMAFKVSTDRAEECYDLTAKVKDRQLCWKAPKGEWRLIAVFCGKTFQKVKRAAPGGEGYVMNHFSARAVKNYLERFEKAFAGKFRNGKNGESTAYPHNFFNDSYEVYGADWTDDLFEQFARRRGYKLEEHLPEFLSAKRTDMTCRIVSDYRETLGELLQENFTRQWTAWTHKHGTKTRNQAHGSPGNLIDIYATVDTPECEGFGLSDFGIAGLRRDSLTRPNDSDFSMLKYASSAAHIAGKPFTSSETFTWLTEHFRTSLSQCKPDMDLMFVSGVNHMFFHGTAYSPSEAAWPGWKFYAAIDMSPTNNIWRDAPAFFKYITRCQSFLQLGKPDNDFLLYLPVYDMWQEQSGRLLLFDIHKMDKRAPRFIDAVHRIYDAGYDMDYISDNFIRTVTCKDGKIVTSGGASYKALIIPGAKLMPSDVLQKLYKLTEQGAKIVFLDQYPEDVPGYMNLEKRRSDFKSTLAQIKVKTQEGRVLFGTDYVKTLAATSVVPEVLKNTFGLSYIRRANETGYHYFISALKGEDTEGWVPLAVDARSVMFFNPLDGSSGKAKLRKNKGRTEVYMKLSSGESIILKTFTAIDVDAPEYHFWNASTLWLKGNTTRSSLGTIVLNNKWSFHFINATPNVTSAPDSVYLGSWTELPAQNAKSTMATASYTTTIDLKETDKAKEWMLDLGDVRESARVRVNGADVAVLFSVPFRTLIGKYLHPGTNTIEIEVTNLPANRIADMDRKGVQWRIFKDANIVNIHYNKENYKNWEPVPSGLLGPVRLIPMERIVK